MKTERLNENRGGGGVGVGGGLGGGGGGRGSSVYICSRATQLAAGYRDNFLVTD